MFLSKQTRVTLFREGRLRSTILFIKGGGQGSRGGAQENRGWERHERQEKKGREVESLWWRKAEEKFKKAAFIICYCLSSSQRNEPNNIS